MSRLRAHHVAILGILTAASATLLGPRPARLEPPHILLITIDTVRADHCSVYGYSRPTTPTLERIADEGVVLEDTYAPMATTAPAHASLFTGLAPMQHGVVKNGYTLQPRFQTLPEILRAAGYDTAAVVSSYALHGKFGLRQGFALYDDLFGDNGQTRRWQWEGHVSHGAFDRDARPTTARSIRWLRTERDRHRPFFLWVHYYDPHQPYAPAPPYDDLFVSDRAAEDNLVTAIAHYDAEIREVDDAIGRLLAELDAQELTSSTLVVVAGDHGEGLMDHGWMHHGLQLYEESIRVPLLVRWPGRIPAGQRLHGAVQLADVTPTVLDLAGLPPMKPAAHGPGAAVSLAPAISGAATLERERMIFFQRRRYDTGQRLDVPVRGEKQGVRAGPWKYVEAPEENSYELYNLVNDPGEKRDLRALAPEQARRLAARLADWRGTATGSPTQGTVPPADMSRLRALGYVD